MVRLVTLATCLLLLNACAWQQMSRQEKFDSAFRQGEYAKAASLAADYGNNDLKKGSSGDLLWALQQASVLQMQGAHAESVRLFDTTEAYFRIYDLQGDFSQWLGQMGATLSDDSVLDYRGMVYDAIMVNSYKALSFMAQGDWANARVELNRAQDRQRRAADYFEEEIAAQHKQLASKDSDSPADLGAAVTNANAALADRYAAMEGWSVYPAFVNPLANWLQGWQLLVRAEAEGDLNKAADALKSVVGMVPDNRVAQDDLRWAEALASGAQQLTDLPPTVWVLVERGLGPVKVEKRVEFPVPLYSASRNQTTFWTGFAYPDLKPRDGAGYLSVRTAGPAQEPQRLASMDAVIGQEFAKRLPGIVTRAVIGSVAKTLIQGQARRHGGDIAGLLALIYQVVTTNADTRIWSSLPKHIELAKLERSTANALVLQTGGRETRIELPPNRFVLVWVRWPDVMAAPAVTVIPAS